MTDDKLSALVARLREAESLCNRASWQLCGNSADAIEALIAERDEWKQRAGKHQRISAELADKFNGTPCAEIRWMQERDELIARAERAEAALRKFNLYLIVDTDSDNDTLPVLVRHLRNARAVLARRGGVNGDA